MVSRTGHRMLAILDVSQLDEYLAPQPDSDDPGEEVLLRKLSSLPHQQTAKIYMRLAERPWKF